MRVFFFWILVKFKLQTKYKGLLLGFSACEFLALSVILRVGDLQRPPMCTVHGRMPQKHTLDWRAGSAVKSIGCSSRGCRNHPAAHNCLYLRFQGIWCPPLTSSTRPVHSAPTYIQAKRSVHIKKRDRQTNKQNRWHRAGRGGPGEWAQWLEAHAVLTESLSLVPKTHMVAHKHLKLHIQGV